MKYRRLLIFFSLCVTAIGIALAFRHVPLIPLWETLKQARAFWILAMIAISFIDLFIRAWRWKALLSVAAPKASIRELFGLEAAGLAINNILFMRLGELARAFLGGRELEIPVSSTFSSVAIERALDLAALLFLFLVAARLNPSLVDKTLQDSMGALFLLTVASLVFLAWAEDKILMRGTFLEGLLSRAPRLKKIVEGLTKGAAALKAPGPAALSIFLSLVLWSVDALTYWAGARALSLHLSYSSSVLVLSWAGAAAALPAAPGGIGPFEALVENIASKLGMSLHAGLAFALLTHAIMYLTVTIIGLLSLYQIGFSLAEIAVHARLLKDGVPEEIHG